MLFKLQPKYKLRKDGYKIELGDQLLIFSTEMNLYLNYTQIIRDEVTSIDLD
jgi:hypothetical protein